MSSQPPGGDRPDTSQPAYPVHWRDWPADDELSLADLIRALGRRWRWIAGCTLVAVLLALAYVLVTPDEYRYSIALSIGEVPRADSTSLIETPGTVIAELESSVIPAAIREVLGLTSADLRNDADVPEVRASSPADTSVVRVRVEGPESEAEQYRDILARVANVVVSNHTSALQAQLGMSREELRRLSAREKSLQERIRALQTNRERLTQASGENGAVALRLSSLDSELSDARSLLLKTRDDMRIAQHRMEVLKQAVPVFEEPIGRESLQEQAKLLPQVSAAANGLRPTRALSEPTRSLEPVGIGGSIIVALALVLGLGAGLVLALLVDAVRRDNQPG